MNWKDHIEVNPAVLVGKPIIKGTRISVKLILDRVADGWTMEDVLAAYPPHQPGKCTRGLERCFGVVQGRDFCGRGKSHDVNDHLPR